MWLTTTTLDLVGIREFETDVGSLLQRLTVKKEELKAIDGHGSSIDEFKAPDSPGDIDSTTTTLVIKRLWNTESAAREFADFLNAASEYITATAQEQA